MGKDQLEIFRYHGTSVRVIQDEQGEPWFVAKDVCEVLEITNYRNATARLLGSMKGVCTMDTPGGQQEMITVSEAGLYKLVFTSRKPEAEKFTDWVASEVLPSIRKHGAYMTPETIEKVLADPDTIIKLATSLKEERTRRKALEEEKKALTPKAEQYDRFMDGSNYKTMEAVAKVLGTGKIRLFRCLRERKVLMANNRPYQQYLDRGYFVVEEKPITMERVSSTTLRPM